MKVYNWCWDNNSKDNHTLQESCSTDHETHASISNQILQQEQMQLIQFSVCLKSARGLCYLTFVFCICNGVNLICFLILKMFFHTIYLILNVFSILFYKRNFISNSILLCLNLIIFFWWSSNVKIFCIWQFCIYRPILSNLLPAFLNIKVISAKIIF